MDEDNTGDFLVKLAAVFWFVAALTIGITSYQVQERTLDMAAKSIGSEDRRLHITQKIEPDETYSGAQVIQTIIQIQNLNVDIQVNDITYPKTIDIENTDLSSVDLHKDYKVYFERDVMGQIQKIIFRG